MKLIDTLNWRYATKRMNGTEVPEEKVDAILQAVLLSASSAGLQPYKIIAVKNKEIRKELQAAAHGQPQLVEGSHVLVFAAYENLKEQDIDDLMDLHAKIKGIPVDSLADFSNQLKGSFLTKTAEENFNWAARQAYIALGTGLIAAAEQQVDATPMEGFVPAEFDKILGLKEQGLRSVVILTLGYRDAANDYLANAPKVRKDIKDLVIRIN